MFNTLAPTYILRNNTDNIAITSLRRQPEIHTKNHPNKEPETLETMRQYCKEHNINLESKLPQHLKREILIENALYRNYPIKAAVKQ